MALATRCPNCQALFRVVADQLKLRGGLVRCGACRHVFDAIGSLAYVDDTSNAATAVPAEQRQSRIAGSMASLLTPAPAPTPTPTPTPAAAPESAGDFARSPEPQPETATDAPAPAADDDAVAAPRAATSDDEATGEETPPSRRERTPVEDQRRESDIFGETPDEETPRRAADRPRMRRRRHESSESPASAEDNPLAVPTLLATHADATVDLNALRAERGATEPAQQSDEESEEEARRRRRRERRARRAAEHEAQLKAQADDEAGDVERPHFLRSDGERRGFSVVFGGGSVVLGLLLFAQAAVLFRTELVTRWPSLRPTIVQLCAIAGCTVSWPTRAELLAVVGTELQAIPGTDVLELRTVIRNRASFKVALPAIEVSLTDTQNRTIARKVFAPVDYLSSAGEPAARIDEGLGAGSDYEVRIAFEARGVNAVGFVVYPFYL